MPSPVALRATDLGVPILKPDHPRDPDFQTALAALAVDCCAVVAYGALLPQTALDLVPHGWVNLHFSCLPAWRGAAPVQHAIRAGDEVTGATTFRIVRELDAGPLFGTMTERIRPDDTAGDLLARLAEGGSGLLLATLDGIEDGTIEARPQSTDGVSFAPKITVEDARVDWRLIAKAVDHLIRSCTPAPGAWTTYDGERLKLGPVTHNAEHPPLAPGELAVTKSAVHVGTGTTRSVLARCKPSASVRCRPPIGPAACASPPAYDSEPDVSDAKVLRRRRWVAGLMLVALVGSTGLGIANNLRADGKPTIEPHDAFDLVDPIGPTRGETETPIAAARINSEGTLQLVIQGSLCSAFTWAPTAETPTDVQVQAFVWIDQTLCPAAGVPWLVDVHLKSPLGTRVLLVGANPKPLDVVDCGAIADADICRIGDDLDPVGNAVHVLAAGTNLRPWADPQPPRTSTQSADPCPRWSWGSRGGTGRPTRCPPVPRVADS